MCLQSGRTSLEAEKKTVEFKNQLYEDAKRDYLKAKTEDVDPKLIQSLRQECRSYLKHY